MLRLCLWPNKRKFPSSLLLAQGLLFFFFSPVLPSNLSVCLLVFFSQTVIINPWKQNTWWSRRYPWKDNDRALAKPRKGRRHLAMLPPSMSRVPTKGNMRGQVPPNLSHRLATLSSTCSEGPLCSGFPGLCSVLWSLECHSFPLKMAKWITGCGLGAPSLGGPARAGGWSRWPAEGPGSLSHSVVLWIRTFKPSKLCLNLDTFPFLNWGVGPLFTCFLTSLLMALRWPKPSTSRNLS